jgi:GTP-binding protein
VDKPEVIALSKADTLDEELLDALSSELEAASGQRPLRVSGATGAGTDQVLEAILRHLGREEAPAPAGEEGWSPL